MGGEAGKQRAGGGACRSDGRGACEGGLPCFFDLSIDMLCIAGMDGYFKALNPAWEKTLGFTGEELRAKPYLEFVHPDDRGSTRKEAGRLSRGVPALVFENRYLCRDGSYRWLSWNSHPVPEKGLIYAVVRDITAQKRTNCRLREANEELAAANEELTAMHEEQIASNEELTAAEEELRQQIEELMRSREALNKANRDLANIIDFLPDATMVIGRDGGVIAWNRAMEDMTGVKKNTIVGKGGGAYAMVIWGKRRPVLADAIISELANIEAFYEFVERRGDSLYTEVFVPRLRGGRGAYVWVKAAPLYDKNGNVTGAIESVRDITERKRSEGKLEYLSTHDSLTGLHNRHYFEREIRRLQKNAYPSVGLILCDVDGLKLVNDSLGHEAGDKLLIAAAELVKGSFRKTDLVARVGGDEFAVLLPGYGKKAVEAGSERIREAVRRYNAAQPGMPLSVSVGYAVSAERPPDMAALFREADNNMYREKLHHSRSARSATVQTLMKALEARDFITEGHADRLQEMVARVGEEMGLSRRTVGDLRLLAQFHDIGKVGIADRLLFKPGPLDPAEMDEMRRHSEIGYRIALSAPDLHPIADWILYHHEWWDGRGYPMGLEGEAIPLACRILALADAYDAMTNDRPYRKAMSHAEAVAELMRCAGTQFDPKLTPRFIRILETMRRR